LLQRLLASVSRRLPHQPSVVLVFDDCRNEAMQRRNQQVTSSAHRRFGYPVHYLGADWQRNFIAELVRHFPGERASIEWLLAARGEGVFTGGRMFNMIMLALAGHRFTLFDDDFKLDRARHLGAGRSRDLTWSRDPERQSPAFDSVRAARAAGQELDIDPIDVHLEFLGQRLGDCLVSEVGSQALLDDSQAGQPPVQIGVNLESHILTTVNGQYGVPIAPNSFYLFYQSYQDQSPIWLDAAKYQTLRRGKALWSVTSTPVISGRTGSTPSGIDNRILMPPTLPHCRGEDTLFCTLLKYLHPGAANLYLPWALEHSRPPVNWPAATFDDRQKIMMAKNLWKKTEEITQLADHVASAEARAEFLARYLLEWCGQSQTALKEDIYRSFEKGVNWRIRIIEESLEQVNDTNSQVYKDLQRGLNTFKASLDYSQGLPELMDRPGTRGDNKGIELLVDVNRKFAKALLAWPALWQATSSSGVLQRFD
jgi:hypothetical protein